MNKVCSCLWILVLSTLDRNVSIEIGRKYSGSEGFFFWNRNNISLAPLGESSEIKEEFITFLKDLSNKLSLAINLQY